MEVINQNSCDIFEGRKSVVSYCIYLVWKYSFIAVVLVLRLFYFL
jgi:hypothetical protein